MKNRKSLCLFLAFVFTAISLCAQTAPVRYTVDFDPQPNTHMLHITMELDGVKAPLPSKPKLKIAPVPSTIDVAFPAWSPGAYRIADGWRQVQEFAATDGSGAALKFEKTDKQTWRISGGKDDKVIVHYNLYSTDFNEDSAYMRGPSTFMYFVGKAPYPLGGPVSLKLTNVPGSWKTQTGLEPGSEANTFTAPDYDTFIDASVVSGNNWEQTEFEVGGIPHYIVFIGNGNFDKQKITDDTKRIVTT